MASGDTERREIKCRPKNPCILIRKLVEIMEHPISENAVERHLQLLNEFLNASHYAFWLQDISYIIRLYESIVKKLDTHPEFKKPLECLLYFSSVPPMLAKPSDKLAYARDLQEYFSVLGYLILCLRDSDLKLQVLHSIQGLLKPRAPIGFCCIPLKYCSEAAERSQLPQILAQLLQVISDDVYLPLLDVVFLTCQISTETCQKMLGENAIEYLLQRLESTWHERDTHTKPKNPSPTDTIPGFEDTCCILWKLLTAVDNQKVQVESPSVFAQWSLQYALRWSVISRGQKLNRNNLIALILKMLVTFPVTEFEKSGLLNDLVFLATAAAEDCDKSCNLKFRDDEMDFHLKKMIWSCLHFILQEDTEIQQESGIVEALSKILFNDPPAGCNIQQRCEFVKIILKVIPKILPHCLEPFLQANGPVKIIQTIQNYLQKTLDIDVLEAYMYCLSEVTMMEINDIIISLGENASTSQTIISVCNKILENDPLTSVHQKILAHGFCTLQILCKCGYADDIEIIYLCLKYLNRVIHPTENDPLNDGRVTICAIHLVWECIHSAKSLFCEFVQKGGIYIMLDVTESCIFPVKTISLGILADSSKKCACVPYLITWRKHGKRLLPMLMEIFRRKQIEDRENHKNQWLSLCSKKHIITFQAKCVSNEELVKSCRSKIHFIIEALKVKFKRTVEIANEHYRLFNDKLNTDDELTMIFAENYSSLKMCETWIDIAKQLKNEGITPVDGDSELLNDRINLIKQWKVYLKNRIEQIVRRETQNENLEEFKTYAILKDARLSNALDALKDLRYISNCTERMFQMRQKLRLQHELGITLAKNSNFHRTFSQLSFTNIFDQTISIQSNIIYEKKAEPCPIAAVSPDQSDSPLEQSDSEHCLKEQQLEC